jgi:hypothetical protein
MEWRLRQEIDRAYTQCIIDVSAWPIPLPLILIISPSRPRLNSFKPIRDLG